MGLLGQHDEDWGHAETGYARLDQENRELKKRVADLEEQANWVLVPWLAAYWLISKGTRVSTHDPITEEEIEIDRDDENFHVMHHYADRRTFPENHSWKEG